MKFVTVKSENLVFQTHRDSLNEIFDILLCTAKLNTAKKKERSRSSSSHNHGNGNDNEKKSENKNIGNMIDKDLKLIAGILSENSFTNTGAYKHSASMDSPPSRKSNYHSLSSPYHKTKMVLEELISQTTTTNNNSNSNGNVDKKSQLPSRNGLGYPMGDTGMGKNDELIIAAAIPQVLQPKILADTIGAILTESNSSAATISREEFICKVPKYQNIMLCRPIYYSTSFLPPVILCVKYGVVWKSIPFVSLWNYY